MARDQSYRYYKSFISIPALFIGIAWLGIWLLWPRNGSTEWPSRSLARTKFVYVGAIERPPPSRDTDLIFMMSPKGREIKGPEDFPMVQEFPSGRAHFLERTAVFYPDPVDVQHASLPTLAANATTTYEPVWSGTESFLMSGPQQPSLHITASRHLGDCGFSLPSELFDDKPNVEDGWNSTLHVKIGAEGKPHQVFLLAPSKYAAVNAWLVRALSQVDVIDVEANCEGWITIEYGGR